MKHLEQIKNLLLDIQVGSIKGVEVDCSVLIGIADKTPISSKEQDIAGLLVHLIDFLIDKENNNE